MRVRGVPRPGLAGLKGNLRGHAERLRSGEGASTSDAGRAAELSLAGTFVTLMRQVNKMCSWLLKRDGVRQGCVPRMMTTMDCAACQHLSSLAYVSVTTSESDEVRGGTPAVAGEWSIPPAVHRCCMHLS